MNNNIGAMLYMDWATGWDSGYAAATEGTNMTQFLSFNGYVLNGTTRKIKQHVQTNFSLNNVQEAFCQSRRPHLKIG